MAEHEFKDQKATLALPIWKVEHEFKDQKATLAASIGKFLADLMLYDGALAMYTLAYETDREIFDQLSPRVANSTARMAYVIFRQGKLPC